MRVGQQAADFARVVIVWIWNVCHSCLHQFAVRPADGSRADIDEEI
jgi:hypothetical protein